MNTLRLQYKKIDFERIMIALGMTLMEVTGIILLICGILDFRPF